MSDIHRMSSFYFEEFFVYLQIERLCDRLQLATRLEDRRDAVRGLKNLSKVKKNHCGRRTWVFSLFKIE